MSLEKESLGRASQSMISKSEDTDPQMKRHGFNMPGDGSLALAGSVQYSPFCEKASALPFLLPGLYVIVKL